MNRYLLRSLIAVSTFLFSIAVSAILHPFGSARWERGHKAFVYSERRCSRAMTFLKPSLSIDATGTDPVKLLYSQTRPQPNSSQQQITFVLDNQTTKAIDAVVVQYSSRWPEKNSWGIETVRVSYDPTANVDDLQTLSIECGSDQTLWLWISRVEFKDGSRWVNPRHSNEQSF
jgi:hypothetical protein